MQKANYLRLIMKRDIPMTESNPNTTTSKLEIFFLQSLCEMYHAENMIAEEFCQIESKINCPKLHKILTGHFGIHVKHQSRLQKFFQIRGETLTPKISYTMKAIMEEASAHLSHFSDDIRNWEFTLVLVAQKFAHYKIAAYSTLAQLAIKLNYPKLATLLAVSVQEEEEFLANNLCEIYASFLNSSGDS